jgi:hypothetical protein
MQDSENVARKRMRDPNRLFGSRIKESKWENVRKKKRDVEGVLQTAET